MVINSLSDSEKIEDQVFWYHAAIHDHFRVCYDDFWENNEYYLKKRLQMADPTSKASIKARKDEDEYYKYVGGRGNKIRYNLNMSEGAEDYDLSEQQQPYWGDEWSNSGGGGNRY